MRVVVDWSYLCINTWHRMGSKNYVEDKEGELEEFTKNIAERLYYLQARFKDADLIIATDSLTGYWRHDYYTKWYEKYAKCFIRVKGGEYATYFLEYDDKVFKINYWEAGRKWVETKLGKKEIEDEDWDNLEQITEVPDYIKALYPKYKGNRTTTWKYDTPYKEFKKICVALAHNVKGFRVCHVDKAEADDIAYAVVKKYQGDNIALVTIDEDWDQLGMESMFVKKVIPPLWEEYYLGKDKAQIVLVKKILNGDIDNIFSLTWKPGAKKVAKKSAETFIANRGIKGALQYLEQNAEPHTLTRNKKLVFLGNVPRDLLQNIYDTLDNAKVNEGVNDWAKMGLDFATRTSIKTLAEAHALNDVT